MILLVLLTAKRNLKRKEKKIEEEKVPDTSN